MCGDIMTYYSTKRALLQCQKRPTTDFSSLVRLRVRGPGGVWQKFSKVSVLVYLQCLYRIISVN